MTIEEKIEKFEASFCPWGWLDIKVAITAYDEAGKHWDDLTDAIEQFSEDCGVPLDKIDPVYVAYDTLMQEARTEIEHETGKDISNDAPYSSVDIVSNFMCTTIDGTDEDREAMKKLIETIKDRSQVVEWLYNNL